MKQGWKIKKLGNVCTILNGGTPSTKIPEYWGGEHLWITPKDMGKLNSIYVDETERKITDEGLRNSSAKLLPINSIIVSTRAPIGHLAINRKLISTNQGCKGIVPSDEINTLYLFNFLKNSVKLLNDLGRGTTFKELSGSKLSSVEIPIPTLSEQKRIVAKLDQCFEAIDQAIANVEKNMQKTDELLQSLLFQILYNDSENWKKSTLGESCEFSNGKAHEKAIDEDGAFVVVNSKFISSEGTVLKYTNEQMFPLFIDDIVMVMSDVPNGKALAKCFLIDKDNTYSLNQRICAIRSEKYIKKYLFYQLNRHKHLLSFNNGENQTNLRKGDILKTPLHILPIDDQEKIVKKLDDLTSYCRTLESHYQQELEALAELKKSILQKAFSGELTTTEIEATL